MQIALKRVALLGSTILLHASIEQCLASSVLPLPFIDCKRDKQRKPSDFGFLSGFGLRISGLVLCLAHRFGPRFLQRDGAIEDQLPGGTVFIECKVGEALKLVALVRSRIL